jgi:NAD(P)-dependent dehydrogenase (short-subunit alcohol dehydrogenase family)
MTTYDFSNKVALVTGASSGIGEATAKRFARDGAQVLVTDIDEENGRRVVDEIGAAARWFAADTSDPAQVEAMVQEAVDAFGGLDIAVNNAGIGGPQAMVGDYPLDGWRKVMSVNLDGVFYGMRYQIPAMLKRGGGSIVNITSILGSVAFANSSAYVAAKHGVVGLTKNAAVEYSGQGIRVNSVGPGFIRTPMVENSLEQDVKDTLAGMHPIGRLGRSEEVAALIVFLASDEASFISGSYHLVDGGYTAL